MLSITSRVSGREDKRLRAVRRPVGRVVERRGVPDDLRVGRRLATTRDTDGSFEPADAGTHLEHQLRNLDGMAGWAGAGGQEVRRPSLGIRHVIAVTRTVQVLAIPACRIQDV